MMLKIKQNKLKIKQEKHIKMRRIRQENNTKRLKNMCIKKLINLIKNMRKENNMPNRKLNKVNSMYNKKLNKENNIQNKKPNKKNKL